MVLLYKQYKVQFTFECNIYMKKKEANICHKRYNVKVIVLQKMRYKSVQKMRYKNKGNQGEKE